MTFGGVITRAALAEGDELMSSPCQGLSQDFKIACPQQQCQNFCPSRFSNSSASNPLSTTSYSLLGQKGQFTLQPCPRNWLVKKLFVIFYPIRVKIENSSEKFLPIKEGGFQEKKPAQKAGRTGPDEIPAHHPLDS